MFKIYTDFDEIRQEIEAETERISGTNKVEAFLSQTIKSIHTQHYVFIILFCADVLYISGYQRWTHPPEDLLSSCGEPHAGGPAWYHKGHPVL